MGVNDVVPDAAEAVVAEIEAGGAPWAVAAPGSVAGAEPRRRSWRRRRTALGPLDILVNNAGVTRDAVAAPYDATTSGDAVDDVVLSGDVLHVPGGRAAAQAAGARASPQGRQHRVGCRRLRVRRTVNYSAAKAGVIGLTKALAREWAAPARERERDRAGADRQHAHHGEGSRRS